MSPSIAPRAAHFRTHYLSYEELTHQVRTWAETHPEIVRLETIGKSSGGRELWLLTIGPEPDRIRPAVWVDGNMHASELCGSSAALAIAEDVIQLHLDPDGDLFGLPAHVRSSIREVLFHVLPRMSPDGAEAVLTTGRWMRSVPRDARTEKRHPRWVSRDVDGNGLALLMRKRDPSGDFVESADVPGLMLVRRLEDEGPYYKLYPEGFIESFDGHTVPEPHFLSDNSPDLNRNFPWSWAPEPRQVGAGPFPGSEPESRAVIEFATRTPQLFAWLNFHTFGGVFIRPLGHEPDTKLEPSDRALFDQIGDWCEDITGYPMVSGFEEFTYRAEQPLHGDLSDFAFHQRGCIAYVCELWDVFRRIEMARPKRFCDYYTHATRDDLVRLARWDREHNENRIYRPWAPLRHPQLGDVEVGGFDPRFGLWNPPHELIGEICTQQSAAFMRVAALAPRLVVKIEKPKPLGADTWRCEVMVENHGYLPTYVLESAKSLSHNEELWVEIETTPSMRVESDPRVKIGHLEGWGKGLRGPGSALHFPRSKSGTRAHAAFVVRGSGRAAIRVGSCRVGVIDKSVSL